MTEEEWFDSHYAPELLEHLGHRASERKLRLYACACCRHRALWRRLRPEARRLVEVAEEYADGRACREALEQALENAPLGLKTVDRRPFFEPEWGNVPVHITPTSQAERAIRALAEEDAEEAASAAARHALNLLGGVACELLREIVGNPFWDYTPEQAWLHWNDGAVPKIAQGIYEGRAFDRLPILHDALLDAGCDNQDILAHCRGAGPHVRGCWVIDLLLGKE